MKCERKEIILPWPPSILSPNSRAHWRPKAAAAKAYRKECWYMARDSGGVIDWEGPAHLWLTFYPPDRRHRDDDNMVAAFKSGRDGLADAFGIDDKRFKTHPFVSDQIGGMIKVVITRGPEL